MEKCECGSSVGLSKRVPMATGWITLTEPTCAECREKKKDEHAEEFNKFHEQMVKRKATQGDKNDR